MSNQSSTTISASGNLSEKMVSTAATTANYETNAKGEQQKQQQEGLVSSPLEGSNASAGGYSSDSSAEAVDLSQLDPATLKARIKAQVEYYFSQQNLNTDAYMMSQMNAEGYIPVTTIASFKKVKNLTSDLNLLVDAVSDSTICELNQDKTMLKTSWKRPARTTIILRDVHDDTVEDDIKELFKDAEYKVVSARSDVGQTWFVTMATEEDAKSAVLYLLGKELNGQPVKARLKSETLRSMSSSGTFNQGGVVGAPGGQAVPVQPGYYAPPAYGQPQPLNYYNQIPVAGGWNPQAAQFTVEQQQQQQPSAGSQQQRKSTPVPPPSQQQQPVAAAAAPLQQQQGNDATTSTGEKQTVENKKFGNKKASHTTLNSGAQDKANRGGAGGRGGAHNATSKPPHNRRPQAPAQGKGKKKASGGPNKRTQQIKTPVFKPQDFPSLPMGKINLDENTNMNKEDAQQHQDASAVIVDESSTSGTGSISEQTVEVVAAAGEQQEEVKKPEAEQVEQSKSTVPQVTEQVVPNTSSWAAAVAKAPPTPPPQSLQQQANVSSTASQQQQQQKKKVAAPAASAKGKKGGANNNNKKGGTGAQKGAKQKQQQQPPLNNNVSNSSMSNQTSTERPKRGWEKPNVVSAQPTTATTNQVAEIVDEVIVESVKLADGNSAENKNVSKSSAVNTTDDSVKASNSSESNVEENNDNAEDKELLKSAFNTWGQKKSFADIIKTAPQQQEAAQQQQSINSDGQQQKELLPGSKNGGKLRASSLKGDRKKAGPKVTSLEGNWRRANRPKKQQQLQPNASSGNGPVKK